MSKQDTHITRARKRMARAITARMEAETVRQERRRASAARGAVMRYKESLYLAEMAEMAEA